MRKISGYFVAVSLIIGSLTLLAWIFGIDILKHPFSIAAGMNALAASCFVLASISFFLLHKAPNTKAPPALGPITAWAVIIIAALKLLTIVGIGHIPFRERILAESAPGGVLRMAPNTILGFLMTGCALLLSRDSAKQMDRIINYLAFITGQVR